MRATVRYYDANRYVTGKLPTGMTYSMALLSGKKIEVHPFIDNYYEFQGAGWCWRKDWLLFSDYANEEVLE